MRYVAFFRGINVGGRNKIKMKDLAQFFIDLGFSQVKTYIQSGNVVFSTEEVGFIHKLEENFVEKFDITSKIIIRNQQEITDILDFQAFSTKEITRANQANPEVVHEYVYLGTEKIDKEKVEEILAKIETPDLFHIHDKEIYLLVDDSVHKSKLANALGRLDFPLTARNMRTLNKVVEMME